MHITFPKANLQKAINVLQKVSQNKTSSNLPNVTKLVNGWYVEKNEETKRIVAEIKQKLTTCG